MSVYEYNGEAFHSGCPHCKSAPDSKWEAKKRDILALGYELETMWSCEFMKVRKDIKIDSKGFPGIFKKEQCEQDILDGIKSGKLFGFVVADINATEHSQKIWNDFPPILRKIKLTEDHLPDHMLEIMRRENPGIKNFERETLCQVFNAKKTVLLSTLAKFYIDQGFTLSNIQSFIQYQAYPALSPFVDRVTEMRINAEKQGNPTKGSTAKGNFKKNLK